MKNSEPPSLAFCPGAPVLAGAQAPPVEVAGTRAASGDGWFTPWRFAGLLLLLIGVAYPDVVLGTHTFFYRDYGLFGYPLAHHHREAFWHGELPFWNSLSNCGLPHLAQWNTMTLYPLSLIYLLLPLPWALGYFCLGHLFLGGMGMYFLAHRWTGNRFAATIAGLGYALNGLTLHALMWPNNIAALGWMPFVVLLTEQGVREGGRRLVLAALVGAVQMLAGAPELILFTWLLAAACCLTARETPLRSRCARFGLAGLLVAALAAAQLLPFLDLVLHSQRDPGYATNVWAMPAWGWANLLVPLFHCTASVVGVYSQDAQQWTSSYYAGIGITALALLGALHRRDRRSLVLGVAALLSLTLALGSAGGVHTVLKKVFPFLGFVRFPIKFVVGLIFAAPLLAALAVARWQAAPETERAPARQRWFWICGLLVALVAVIVTASAVHPVPGERWAVTAQSGLSRVTLLCAVTMLLLRLQRVTTSGTRISLVEPLDGGRSAEPPLGASLLWSSALRFMERLNLRRTDAHRGHEPLRTASPRSGARTCSPQQARFMESERAGGLWLRLGFVAVLGLDVLTHMPRQNPTVPVDALAAGAIRRDGKLADGARAMVSPRAQAFFDFAATADTSEFCRGNRRALLPNWNLVEGIPSAGGFYSLYTAPQNELRALWSSRTNVPSALADVFGVRWISSETDLFDWQERPSACPLVTAGQRPVFANREETLRALAFSRFDPAKEVLLARAASGQVQVTNSAHARVLTSRQGAVYLEAEVESDAPALVTIAQTDYPGWSATVNGRPARLWPANHAFQAVEIPAGASRVRLVYRERTFGYGAGLSLLSVLACAMLWWRGGARRAESSTMPA